MKLYTRGGDEGGTDLLFGGRVSKADVRVAATGAVDTAVSAMGLARALCRDARVKEVLLRVQRQGFTVGAELATDPEQHERLAQRFAPVTAEMTAGLESLIDDLQGRMELPQAFIVPGGSSGSGALDLARSLVRAAERRVVELHEAGRLANPEVLRFLNRLSDLLFVLARFEDRELPVELASDGDR